MHSHAGDLRVELHKASPDQPESLSNDLVAAVLEDWHQADLPPVDRALCTFAEKLTRTPGAMVESDVTTLRDHGFDDVAINDAIQVISYFNYINRVADATHVDLDAGMPAYPQA